MSESVKPCECQHTAALTVRRPVDIPGVLLASLLADRGDVEVPLALRRLKHTPTTPLFPANDTDGDLVFGDLVVG